MKVDELIALLREVPQNAVVIVVSEDGPSDVCSVERSDVRYDEIVYLKTA